MRCCLNYSRTRFFSTQNFLYHDVNVSFLVIAGKEINVTMTIKDDKKCSDAEGQYNKSSLSRELSVTVKLQM